MTKEYYFFVSKVYLFCLISTSYALRGFKNSSGIELVKVQAFLSSDLFALKIL